MLGEFWEFVGVSFGFPFFGSQPLEPIAFPSVAGDRNVNMTLPGSSKLRSLRNKGLIQLDNPVHCNVACHPIVLS